MTGVASDTTKRLIAAGILLAVEFWFVLFEALPLFDELGRSYFVEMLGYYCLVTLLSLVAMWVVVKATKAQFPPIALNALALPAIAMLPAMFVPIYGVPPEWVSRVMEEAVVFAFILLLIPWSLKHAAMFAALFFVIRYGLYFGLGSVFRIVARGF